MKGQTITGTALGGYSYGPGLGRLWLDLGGLQVLVPCTGDVARWLHDGVRYRRAVRLSRRLPGPWDGITDLGFNVEPYPLEITDAMRGIAS